VRPIVLGMWFAFALLQGPAAQAGDPARKKEARMHFAQGEKLYHLGKFSEALAEYSRAYQVLPLPGFLFNIGQCHRMLGDCEQALFFFKGYLREQPKAKNRALVEGLISGCEKKIAEQKAALESRKAEERRLAEARRAAEEEKARQEQKRAEEARALERLRLEQLKAAREKELAAASRPAAETSSPFYKTWWFWTVAGVVIAGAATSAYFALRPAPSAVNPSGSLGTVVW